jgi:hypothetical protein
MRGDEVSAAGKTAAGAGAWAFWNGTRAYILPKMNRNSRNIFEISFFFPVPIGPCGMLFHIRP